MERRIIDPESLEGKIWLLLIDKIILGSVVGLAFIAYTHFQRLEPRRYDNYQAEIQRIFKPPICQDSCRLRAQKKLGDTT